MSSVTLELPDELARRLKPIADQLPEILELGLRELNAAGQSGFQGAAELLEFLAGLPTPEETLALHPSEALQERINALLEKSRTQGLAPDEEQDWERYQYLEHLVRIAKAQALLRTQAPQA